MKKTPRKYQKQVSKKGNIYIAFEMRLGKSFSTLLWLENKDLLAGGRKILIVSPGIVSLAWRNELLEEDQIFYNMVPMTYEERKNVLTLPAKKNKALFFLVNYESIYVLFKEIQKAKFDAIVLDEATRIKSPKAQVTKRAIWLSRFIPYRLALAGLPAPEGIADLYCQMAFVNGGDWLGCANYWEFRKTYFTNPDARGFNWVPSLRGRKVIKETFQREASVMTRKQAGLKEKKIYKVFSGKLQGTTKDVYDKMLETWETPNANDSSPEECFAKHSIVPLMWARMFTGGNALACGFRLFMPWKLEKLLDLCNKELKSEQIVVWFAFKEEANTAASKPYLNCPLINGETDKAERVKIINRFQKRKFRVLCIMEQVGKYGIKLDAADTAIYYSNEHSLEARAQSEDRIISPGRKDAKLIIDLVTEDTIDEDIHRQLKRKKINAKEILSKIEKKKITRDNDKH